MDAGVKPEPTPVMPAQLQNNPDSIRAEATDYDPINVATEDAYNIFPVGLKTMDRGIKEFFQDMDVPTKDGTRKLDVRIAGGDKTILFWKQLIEKDNRIRLPVMSVNRTGWRLNPNRNTPASVGPYYYRRFADREGSRMALAPREYSVLVTYALSVWTERKRDMEYVDFQVTTRFNPLAEWTVEDEFMRGNIIGRLENVTDNSDVEIDPNQLAKVRYDFNIEIEGWMPLPGRVVPTVLGKVTELAETDTREFFETIKPNDRG